LDKERRADLRAVYQATQDTRLDFRGRIWDTIKTSATLVAGLLVAAAAVIVRRDETDPVLLISFGCLLIVVGASTGVWNYLNAQEEQKHQLKQEFVLYQIERLLGLHQEIVKDDRWPKQTSEYRYMFEAKHLGGEEVAQIFEKKDTDAPNAYAEARSKGGARWRLAVVSVLLGVSPMVAGGLLLGPVIARKNVRMGDDIRSLKELSAVIERVEGVDEEVHAQLIALARKIAGSRAVKRGAGEGPPGK